MDGSSLLVGIGVGVIVGGIAAFVIGNLIARARSAAAEAANDALSRALKSMSSERDAERTRAEQEYERHGKTQQELRAIQERSTEREESVKRQFDEREKSMNDLRQTIEQSRTSLTDTFKVAGAEVMRMTAEALIRQTKQQFEGQQKLSQVDLEARQKAIDATLVPLREQLVKQEQLVKDLSEKREGDAQSFSEQLKQIADLQQKATSAAQMLAGAMRDNRQRGQWGEVALRSVVEMAGLTAGIHFTEQESLDGDAGRLRPDMIVRLPSERFIAVDSKVPLTGYMQSIEPDITDVARADFRQQHAQAVRNHVRTLHSRGYAAAVEGEVEFTVLFIPIESAFTAAFETDPTIHEEAMRKKVLVVTPSTLLVLLRTVAMHWSNARMAENAVKIGDEAKELVKRIGTFVKHLNGVGEKLGAANEAYNSAISSFERRLIPAANRVANLSAVDDVQLGDPIDAMPRLLMLPEANDPEP
jgi:DNA recombination protein RmuC